MGRHLLHFVTASVAMLVVGTVFGIWFGHEPFSYSPGAYVEQQQQMIRALNVKMPLLGLGAIASTLACAYLARGERRALALLLGAAGCFLVMGAVTRFLNQPINAIVIEWSPAAPPTEWSELRDKWWTFHAWRTSFGVVGFALLLLGLQAHGPRAPYQGGGASVAGGSRSD